MGSVGEIVQFSVLVLFRPTKDLLWGYRSRSQRLHRAVYDAFPNLQKKTKLHKILHLCDDVRLYGPILSLHSGPFESKNKITRRILNMSNRRQTSRTIALRMRQAKSSEALFSGVRWMNEEGQILEAAQEVQEMKKHEAFEAYRASKRSHRFPTPCKPGYFISFESEGELKYGRVIEEVIGYLKVNLLVMTGHEDSLGAIWILTDEERAISEEESKAKVVSFVHKCAQCPVLPKSDEHPNGFVNHDASVKEYYLNTYRF